MWICACQIKVWTDFKPEDTQNNRFSLGECSKFMDWKCFRFVLIKPDLFKNRLYSRIVWQFGIMFPRNLKLSNNYSFFLFGPRGVGKSSWLKAILPEKEKLQICILVWQQWISLASWPVHCEGHFGHSPPDHHRPSWKSVAVQFQSRWSQDSPDPRFPEWQS